jgi:Ca-activated chloride channel family protein
MADELKGLRENFSWARPPAPRPAARERAIAEAVARFETLQHGRRKGFRLPDRLIDAAHAARTTLTRRRSMQIGYALAGSAGLAVLAIAVINTAQMQVAVPRLVETQEKPEAAPPLDPPSTPSSRGRHKNAASVQATSDDEAVSMASKAEDAPVIYAPSSPVPVPMDVLGGAEADFSISSSRDGSSVMSEYRSEGAIGGVPEQITPHYRDHGRDRFANIEANPVKVAAEEPVSTFSIDVDTSSYAFVRATLNNNVLPQKDAVRVEELINYFPYDYPAPEDRAAPFRPTVSVFPTPWNPATKLIHIGIRGFTIEGKDQPPANLVFLIDTSGSMDEPNKLPLLRNAMKMLVETLDADDRVAIVTYAGNAGTVLEPTAAREKAKILAALDSLTSAGSTAGAEGIRQAYQLAERNFNGLGINRVILATDGDFNVGITDPDELKSFVERKRETGTYLSVLGFGTGNYNDELMQTLAQNGNGNAVYIDNLNEARKALVDGASAMLFPIAKDVKIQVEFNPQTVSEYRLIGYETRLLNREDFNNDKVDAGEIGSGHTVTALYEITPKDSAARLSDPLRYGTAQPQAGTQGDEYAFLKIRYKLPESSTSELMSTPVIRSSEAASITAAPQEARFAAAVAAFGQILRGGRYTGDYTYDDVIALALSAKGADAFGYRAEFINLVRIAKTAQSLAPLPQ